MERSPKTSEVDSFFVPQRIASCKFGEQEVRGYVRKIRRFPPIGPKVALSRPPSRSIGDRIVLANNQVLLASDRVPTMFRDLTVNRGSPCFHCPESAVAKLMRGRPMGRH